MSAHGGRACGGESGDGLAPLGLGVKLQMVHHHGCDDDHYRPFPWNGPTRGEDIYSVVAVPGFGVRALQQPFDISSPAVPHHQHHLSAFKSPGAGAMAATLGFPFTDAQWKELQRQAMIYKYMMASVPVPPDLLLPIASSHPATAPPPPLGGGFKLRFSGGTDPEPGRCRRTDGKKWRCSRDAAPDQKYCERHLHRGRPRSRKPVEHQVNAAVKKTKTSHHHSLTLPIPTPPLTSDISTPTISSSNGFRTQAYHDHQNQNIMVLDRSGEKATTLDPPPRGLEMMMMKGIAQSNVVLPQWHHQNLNNPHYTDLNYSEEDNDHQQSFKFNPAPRGFIDAWSEKNTTISADPELTLGGSSTIEEEMGQIQMGLGLTESSQSTRTHQWMSSGGPLAEVLRPSSIPVGTITGEEASSLSSPVGTAASSPSGVLQKGLVSLSDSSGSSSPTTFAMPLPLQWLNQRPG